MTRQEQTVDRNTIEQAWFSYCDSNTPAEVTVVFSEEVSGSQGPRAPKPFITIKLLSGPTPKGSNDNLRFKDDPGPPEENNVTYELSGLRQHSVSLQAFGDGSQDNLAKLQTLFGSPAVVEFFKANGDIAIVSRGTVIDISAVIDVGFERRHSLDVIFNTSSNIDVVVGSIEKAEVGGTLKKADDTEITVDPVEIP